jgi:adhesin HecA-like repeat protein
VQPVDLLLLKGHTGARPTPPGLVVLRCQGRMELGGNLRRATGRKLDQKKAGGGDGTPVDGAASANDAPFTEGDLALGAPGRTPIIPETLSAWLARMRGENRNCTVLVAGGDLVVDSGAEVTLDTPLLLVAGGVVRIEGSVRVSSGSIFVLGDGGGLDVEPTKQSVNLLTMDAPRGANPLRREIHCAVLSSPLPPRGSVLAWKRASKGPYEPADTRLSVRYVREIETMPAHIAELQPADDPTALDPPGPIQVLIELWMKPSAVFEPPFVDFVELQWEQRVMGRPR